jgi:hypothetical protein
MDLWSETERWVRKGEQEAVSSIQRDAEVVFNFHSLHIKQQALCSEFRNCWQQKLAADFGRLWHLSLLSLAFE